MTCTRLLNLNHIQYICIFFILYLVFHDCGKSQMEENRSKKSPNHICSLLQIWLECISLVLLDLPCYHHETEVVLLNVNTSIHTRKKIWSSLKFNCFFIFRFISLIWYSVTLFYECIHFFTLLNGFIKYLSEHSF